MNERIRELVKRAGGRFSTHNLASNPIQYRECIELWDDKIEKFAELIVWECLDISHRESHLPNTVLFDERSDKFIKDIHNRVARATREHFGVGE